ncbi:MAG: trypsin-like peptidase domain-containing protein [Chloroflexi bacterium]|nr:trypsin-like peptidase domain-containing protein [Chloroflexota bacterium]
MKTKQPSIALVVIAIAMIACQATGNTPAIIPTIGSSQAIPGEPINLGEQQDTLVALYQRVSASIVAIQTSSGGLGSGFVFDQNGHIVTNFHVVEGEKQVEVDFMSGYKTYGNVIGTDLDSDLAVVKVDAPAEELNPVTLGNSDELKVGQTVVAIGNPFGLNGTMTMGIISALGRTSNSAHATSGGGVFTAGDLIQTDAAINPGNSGGPLFNLNGEVIGVNREILSFSTTNSGQAANSGIGLAISSNIVKRVVPVLISNGKYDYPYLGISSRDDMSLDIINALGLTSFTGAYVTDVVNGGPADKAGIKAGDKTTSIPGVKSGGDLIIAIDGRAIRRFDELLAYLITNKAPGDTVVLTVLRGDEKVDISIELGRRP